MVRKQGCRPKEGLNRGAWTVHEDKLLSDYVKLHGLGRWRNLPANAGLNRCGKSCRLRWLNYLRPDIKRGNITEEEEELIIRLHKLLGNRWSLIAGRLPGRTDNEIKNYWNTHLSKKFSDQQYSPPPPPFKNIPSTDDQKKQGSEITVIRTKAVRCTRHILDQQVSDTNNYPDLLMPTAPFLSDCDDAIPILNQDVEGFCMVEDSSFLSQVAMDGTCCMSSDSLYDIGGISNSDAGIYNSDAGFYSFLDDADAWDSIII